PKGDKDFSWKAKSLTTDEAVEAIEDGYNIGIAATDTDQIVIIDIDDPAVFIDHEFSETLMAVSGGRIGNHAFYMSTDLKTKINVALENEGEIRSSYEYVVAPGSWARITGKADKHGNIIKTIEQRIEEIPEADRENAGKYELINDQPIKEITYRGLPKRFTNAYEKGILDDEIKARKKEERQDRSGNKDKAKSGFYSVKLSNVEHFPMGQSRFGSQLHDSSTGANSSISANGELHACWRDLVTHNGLQYAAVKAGMYTCGEAGKAHSGSGAGQSRVDLQDGETVYKLWKYLKETGVLPQNDPMPSIAMTWYALDKGYCKTSDIKEGWRLPPGVYIKILKEHGLFDEKSQTETSENKEEYTSVNYAELKSKHNAEKRRIDINFGEDHYITKYTDYMKGITDAYHEFGVGAALVLLSAIAGGKMILNLKQDPIKPNIQVMLIANSTTSRKSTAVNKCEGFFDSIEVMRKAPSSYSPEGLIEYLAEYPKSAFFRDEVAGLLAEYKKPYMNGIRDFDCLLYDGRTIAPRKLRTKKGVKEEFEIKDPYVVKFYATTPDSLSLNTDLVDLTSGYLFRFLYFTPTYEKDFMPLDMEVQENIDLWADILKTGKQLKANIDYLSETKNDGVIKFGINKDALEFIQGEQELIERSVVKSDDSILASIVGRATPYAFKLAMLIEIGKKETSYTITLDSMQKGLFMAMEYFVPNLKELVDYVIADEKCNQIDKIINYLKRQQGISTHTEALRNTKLKAKEFKECIETLIESETIQVFQDEGSKKTLYKLMNEDVSKIDYKIDFDSFVQSSPDSPSSPSSPIHSCTEKASELSEPKLKTNGSNGESTTEDTKGGMEPRNALNICVSSSELGNSVNSVNSVNSEISTNSQKDQRTRIKEVHDIILSIQSGNGNRATRAAINAEAEDIGIDDTDAILKHMAAQGQVLQHEEDIFQVF
ncbi:DUF3987 domain-containing protein, partial [bacterium]|nr:DUF3987 domain-containing protein [bacterium]